jgi:hypothetical protein
MSLHDLANQVQSAGRNDDKVLVHMTPGEVSGLQSLAMAHGGSLTVNPQTGLPEAGFLSSLLPMAIGFGLAPFTGGLSAALITGAGYTAATGSLKKGLMAGLGAYGGAGLASGLNAMGAQAANAGAGAGASAGANLTDDLIAANMQRGSIIGGANVAPVASAQTGVYNWAGGPLNTVTNTAANTAVLNTPAAAAAAYPPPVPGQFSYYMAGAGKAPTLTASTTNLAPAVNTTSPAIVNTSGINTNAALSGKTVVSGGGRGNAAFNANYTPPPSAVDVGKVQANRGLTSEARAALEGGRYPYDPVNSSISRPFTDYMSQVGQGAKNVYAGGVQGLKDLYAAMPEYSVAAGLGGTGLSYLDERREEAEEEMRNRKASQDEGLIRPYTFDYGTTNISSTPYSGSAERTYFQPTYTAGTPYKAPGPEYAAEGGLMGLAVGGPVEEMASMNAVGANTGYPMAALQTPMYANPAMQRPEAMNVIAPSADYGVSTYSGEPRFAKGGGTAEPQSSGYSYDYNPQTQQFTQTGGPGATKSKMPTGEELAQGVAAHDMLKRFNEHILTGKPYNSTPSFISGATPNGAVSGGIAAPMMQPTQPAQPAQPAAPAQSFVPNIDIPAYQTPEQQLGLGGFYDYMNQQMGGYGGYAAGGNVGGVSHLGDYSDGGRLLKGPGDGVSDSIPASIGGRQPARLADGEFVIPARIVSEIGNGSTEAGARKLYAMMDRVQRARRKTVGKNQVAKNTKAEKLLPA